MQVVDNNKQQLTKLQQLLKADEDLPEEEEEEEEEYKISSGQKTLEKQADISSTSSNPAAYEISIRQEDIVIIALIQLLGQPNLNKLTYLQLDLTNLIGQSSICLLLSSLLSKLQNLQKLNFIIQENEITDVQAKQLALGFQSMKQLRSLKLNMKRCFSKDKFHQIILLYQYPLSSDPLFSSGFKIFFQMFSDLKNLQQLELIIGNDYLNKIDLICLSQGLNSLCFLTSLFLVVTHERKMSSGFQTLLESISKMVFLETLILKFTLCELTTSQSTIILNNIQPLINLKHFKLTIHAESFIKKQLLDLTQNFKRFKQLQTLQFWFPNSTFIPQTFPLLPIEEDKQQFLRVIKMYCLKNARSLVNYEMRTDWDFETF